MEPILFRYRGRDLCAVDVALVRATIAAHYARGRSFIAQVLCEHWAWRQPNGAYKGFAARDLLLRLEVAGHVTLPPRKAVKNNRAEPRFDRIPRYADTPLSGRVEITLRPGSWRSPARSAIFGLPGASLPLPGASPAGRGTPQAVGVHRGASGGVLGVGERGLEEWATRAVDRLEPRAKARAVPLRTNNVRFLLLPWVRVEHLASKVLGMSARGLSTVRQARYGHPLVLAETFVDLGRFQGTCYRAANWQYRAPPEGMPSGAMSTIDTGWRRRSTSIRCIAPFEKPSPRHDPRGGARHLDLPRPQAEAALLVLWEKAEQWERKVQGVSDAPQVAATTPSGI